MKCVICKVGETEKGKASFTLEQGGSFVVFANVDADVCGNCGEAYFDSSVAKDLHRKATEEFKKGKEIELVKL